MTHFKGTILDKSCKIAANSGESSMPPNRNQAADSN